MSNLSQTRRANVGTIRGEGNVEVWLTIETRVGEFTTVEHLPMNTIVRVSIMAEVKRHGVVHQAGQAREALLEINDLRNGWTVGEAAELYELWNRWHLNDMQAGCAHMPMPLATEPDFHGGRRTLTGAGNLCTAGSGYGWGTAWLVEQVPTEVLDRLDHLFRDRTSA